ncbi:hypothetical protein CVT26_011840 [Gymnopilus dilepis]|uniref:F-box domain-containing protein n=1 Tax=Gymnopilus dilepis TaxID=231916 RepID=A0A409YG08_9AGAR|nr:hypothetical protein CVT26_011840 [Gymnopilus dilepis]
MAQRSELANATANNRASRDASTEHTAFDINSFPPEILSLIFVASTSKLLDGPDILEWAQAVVARKKLITTTPLLLGSVCQLWRRIAWSSPRLWTFIRLSIGSRTVVDLEVLSAWLDRSGQLPLFIGVSGSSLSTHRRAACLPWINLINQHSARWHELYLYLPLNFLSLFHTQHTTLQILCLRHNLPYFQEPHSIDLRRASPTELELHSIWVSTIDIQFGKIRRALVDSLRVEDCVEFLKRAPRLDYLKIRSMTSAHAVFVHFSLPTSPIIQDGLRTLELDLSESAEDSIADFWNSIALPNLETLNISLESLQVGPFVAFLKRSACPVTKFRLQFTGGADDGEDDLIHILEQMQYLQKLNLRPTSRRYSVDRLLQRLAKTCVFNESTFDSAFLPCLESFQYFSEKGIPWYLLASIFGQPAELKNDPRRPLKHVEIYFEIYSLSATLPLVYMSLNTVEHFVQILERGNEIKVTFPDPDTNGRSYINLQDIMERSRGHWRTVNQSLIT